MTDIDRLIRIRAGVRSALTLGVAASITANVLHAQPNVVGRAIAAWPPLALLITVELISRVPVHSRRLAALRVLATAGIAGIAAWVSYWHMVGVAVRYGEPVDSAHLIPLSVDGLVVVASICLVEIGARLRSPLPAVAPTGVTAEESTSTGRDLPDSTSTPTPDRPGTPTDAPTGTPDRPVPDRTTAPLAPTRPGRRTQTGRALALVGASDEAALARLRQDIAGGHLKPGPGATTIRTHIGCGTAKARRLRDLLQTAPGDGLDEEEAAHA